MADIPSVLKTVVQDPKRSAKTLSVAVFSAVTAVGTALGVDEVQPKELLRPVLRSAGFYEVSADYQDTEAMIRRIQDIGKTNPDHVLISSLRTLSKEGRIPFEGREREVRVRLSSAQLAGNVSVVCRSSDLRDTYLQYNSPRVGLITLKLEDGEPCNHAAPDEVQLSQDTWNKLELRATTGDVKLTMNVLLYPPVELVDRTPSAAAPNSTDTQLASAATQTHP